MRFCLLSCYSFKIRLQIISHIVTKVAALKGCVVFRDFYRLLDSLVVECWLQVREVPVSIPSQGQRNTKDVIKMVPVVPFFWHSTLKREILAHSEELR